MNIFKKRPLSLILCIMLGGFSLFIDASSYQRMVLVVAALIAFAISFNFKHLLQGRILLVNICCIAFAISVILSQLFASLFVPGEYIDKSVRVLGEVSDIQRGSYSTTVTLKATDVNGNRESIKLLVSGEKSAFSNVIIGDGISLCGVIEEFTETTDGFDQRSYYISRGYHAKMVDVSDVEVINPNYSFNKGILRTVRDKITSRLRLETNAQTGGFLAALIMGDKSNLDANTNLNYSLIGISHILALSGMHLVILSETVRRLLSRLCLNKKAILLASTAFCLFYMAVTGFSASVVRSAVMLTITNGLFLLTGSHDSYTTLPLSVVLILIVQPYAVYDISLWLSAFATLGVLIFAEMEEKREKPRGIITAAFVWIWQSILATILAVGASYLIILTSFRTTSVFAPLTTLIFSAPINFLIFAGIALLLLYPIIPLGKPIILITDAINEAAEWVASIQWGNYSMSYTAVQLLVIAFSILFFAMIVLDIRHMRAMLSAVLVLFFASSIVGVILTQIDRYEDEFSYITDEYADTMLLKWDGEVTLIRNGRQTKSAAYSDSAEITAMNLTSINSLLLTSYQSGAVTYAETFLARIKTDTLYIPVPATRDEMQIAETLAHSLSISGSCLRFYERETPISFGECLFYPLLNEPFIHGDVTDCIYTIKYDGEYYTYLSRGATEYHLAISQLISYSSDYIIFGSYGEPLSDKESYPLASDNIKGIYYSDELPLTADSYNGFIEKDVPIEKISTSYEIIH